MLKNVFSRLAREIERSQSGKRRGNSPVPVLMQIEQLEPRQLLTNTVTANYSPAGAPGFVIHQLTIELTNPSPQDLTVDPNDDGVGNIARFHVEILGPVGFLADPPASHTSPRVELGGEDENLNGALDAGEDVVNASLQPNPDGVLQATVLGFENLTLLPLEAGANRRKFVGDFSVDVGANRTATLPIVVRRAVGDPSGQRVATIAITTDTIGPTITSVSAITTPRSTAVSSVTVTFDSAITASSFTANDVTLLRNNLPVVPPLAVTINSAGGNSFTIDGLADDTATDGDYDLTISAAGVTDLPGNSGSGSVLRSWTKTTPSSPTLAAADDSGRESDDGITNQLSNLTFSGSADGAATVQVRLTLNGGGMTTSNAVLNGSSYTAEFAGPLAQGTYTVEALVSDGITTVTSPAGSLTLDATAPAQLTALDLTSLTDTEGPQISIDDNLTSSTTPTFTFSSAETDAAVTLVRDSVNGTPSTPLAGSTVSSITASTTAAGVHTFAVFQTDVAGNVGATSSSLSVAIDTTNPVVGTPSLTTSLASNLKVPITTSTTPTVRVNVTEQTFTGFTNLTRVELVNKADNSVLRTSDVTITTNNVAQQVQLTPTTALASGQYTVFVRATDAAGNTANSSDFSFFISQPGLSTTDAPSTPVFSETYFLGSTVQQNAGTSTNMILVDRPIPVGFTARINGTRYVVQSSTPSGANTLLTLNQNLDAAVTANVTTVAWLRPWTQTFDRTTQTIWFTNEDGHRLGQFDPATGLTKLYEIGLPDGTGLPTATDPHGVFFDFDTHITPRVWFVYRNNASDNDTPDPANSNEIGRVSYLDLATGELLTFDFTGLMKSDNTPLAVHTHAAFTDARGHLWLSAEESGVLIELDFDQQLNGALSGSINSRVGRIIAHELPEELGDRTSGTPPLEAEVTPHGIGTVIDERTGEQYIYFTDENLTSTGRLFLLKPGRSASSDDPGIADRWVQWDIDAALMAEGRQTLTSTTSHSQFLSVDDHETPGFPEDDTIVVADPGGLARRGAAGVVRRFQVDEVIKALQAGASSLPPTARVETVRIPKIPGADASQEFAATQVPFHDREGNVFFVDGLGSVGRFNFDDPLLDPNPGSTADESDIQAPVTSIFSTSPPSLFAITMTSSSVPPQVLNTSLVSVGAAGRDDRSQGNGIDQYEVAMASQRTRSDGAFRGFLNGGNTVSGSLAQSDFVSTTIFAETARRQMSVAADPTALPAGAIVEGRMAFQVGRNGSLIMTSREHGQILDQQSNVSRGLILSGATASQILIDGDTSTVTDPNGDVHVFGKNQVGGLVEYRFVNATNVWSRNVLPAPATGLLAGEPSAFRDEFGHVGALINRNDGHLLLYRNDGSAPTDLTALAGGGAATIFAAVGIVEETASDTLFAYGADQSGNVVQYSFSTTTATPSAATAGTIMVTTRPGSQVVRDTQIFQALTAVRAGGSHHIFGTDGHSRLVHLEITTPATLTAAGENVTELTKRNSTGYFDTFQQGVGQQFAARVSPELAVLVDPIDGNLYVYGTNGLDLVEFARSGTSWTAADLTNDIMKGVGDRVPANKVFGAPGAYVTSAGDRHVFQINNNSEVIEYAFRRSSGHFNTQNINLARGNYFTDLQNIGANVAPTLSVPATALDVIAGVADMQSVLIAENASVSDPDSANFQNGNLIVRTINSSASDVLSIRSQTLADGDVIASSAGMVSFNGTPFGSVSGGTGSNRLLINFSSSTSQDAIEALLQSLEFSAPAGSSIGVRFVDLELTDNLGAPSNRVAQQVTVDDNNPLTNPLIRPLL